MTEPMIEETEAEVEEFTDELSEEVLDRVEVGGACGCGFTGAIWCLPP